MPVVKKGDKWAIGSGKAIYDTKEKAERAYRGYLASQGNKEKPKKTELGKDDK